MRRILFVSFLVVGLLPLLLSAQQTAKSIQQPMYPTIGYLEYLPPGYDTATQNFPVIVFLHGSGESGDGTPEQLEKLKVWGPPSLVENGHDMCFTVNGKKECFIVISPQIVLEVYSWPHLVPLVIDHLLKGPDHYKADPERIYLTGLSRGGQGVYGYAGSKHNRPNKLAAIAPIAARPDESIDGCDIASRQIPVWAFHGKKDTVIPYPYGLNAFNAIFYCTRPEPTAEMIFTTYENWYHDSWIPAYDTSHAYQNPNLYEWLLLQKRNLESITDVGDSDQPTVQFSIHPNPSQGNLINLSYDQKIFFNSALNIWTSSGRLIHQEKGVAWQLDISRLPPGIYTFQLVSNAGALANQRFIKIY